MGQEFDQQQLFRESYVDRHMDLSVFMLEVDLVFNLVCETCRTDMCADMHIDIVYRQYL